MKLILLGAPGAGKGTHAQRLVKEYNIPQISTGDIFRQNIKDNTVLGMQLKDIIARGEYVPDDITVAIVADRLSQPDCTNGYILDGFPRTVAQAEALEGFQNIDKVVNIVVDDNKILDRLTGRRFCPSCNGTFHISSLQSDVCPTCGDNLITREDDNVETVKHRLEVYESSTKPLVDYYSNKGKLVAIDGNGTVQLTYDRILEALGK